jgi:iron complex outermembrane receptor protein
MSVSLFAGSLDVRVTDPQDATIPKALIRVTRADGRWTAESRSDLEGRARFDSLPPGAYLVTVQAAGFAGSPVATIRVDRAGAETITIQLEIAAVEESIVVTSSVTAEPLRDVSKSMSVVESQEIELRDEYSIPEALRTVPGLRVQQLGGPGSFTSIKTRGLRKEDTAVLIDGVRFRDPAAPQGDASSYLETLVTADVDRIEILRGTGSTLYGTNAGGGVINVVTAPGGGTSRGSVLAEGGGLGTLRGSVQTAGGFGDRFLYSVGVTHLNVSKGIDGNDAAKNTSVQGRAGVRLNPDTNLSFRFYGADARSDLNESPEAIGELPRGVIDAVPGDNFLPAANDPDNYRESTFYSSLLTFDQRPRPGFGYSLRYHGLLTDRNFVDGPEGVTAFEPLVQFVSEFEGDIHTLSTRTDFELGSHQLLNAGYELEYESMVNRSLPDDPAENSSTAVSQTSHTFYLQDQVTLIEGALSFTGAVRAQLFNLEDPTFSPSESASYQSATIASLDDAVTGDISAVYAFVESGTRLRAHFGSGYRAPSLFERFGSSYSSFGFFVFGDPRLRPEHTQTFDVGLEQDLMSNRARLAATFFRTRLSEIIIFDFSGAIDPETDPWGRFSGYVSTEGGVTQGLELVASLAPMRGLRFNISYTFTDAEPPTGVIEDQTQAFAVPRHQLALVVSQTLGERLTLSFDTLASSSYLAPIFDPVTFASRVYRFDGYVKSDLVASCRLSPLRLFAKVENLFDQEIFESGFPTPGRYALAGIAFEF